MSITCVWGRGKGAFGQTDGIFLTQEEKPLLSRDNLSILYEDLLHTVDFPIPTELNSGVLLFELIVKQTLWTASSFDNNHLNGCHQFSSQSQLLLIPLMAEDQKMDQQSTYENALCQYPLAHDLQKAMPLAPFYTQD